VPVADVVTVAGEPDRVASLLATGGGVRLGAVLGGGLGWPPMVPAGRGVVYVGADPPPVLAATALPPVSPAGAPTDGGWSAAT